MTTHIYTSGQRIADLLAALDDIASDVEALPGGLLHALRLRATIWQIAIKVELAKEERHELRARVAHLETVSLEHSDAA